MIVSASAIHIVRFVRICSCGILTIIRMIMIIWNVVLRRDHNAVLSGDQSETADDEFSGDNDDDDPGRDPAQLDQADHTGDGQDLVRERIHELSEVGDQIVLSRNIAIQKICQGSDDEQHQRDPLEGFIGSRQQQRSHEKRYQYHTYNSKFIRQATKNGTNTIRTTVSLFGRFIV